jgi:hypothetical protein
MGDSFFAYLQQLELLIFFSGYPMIYALVFYLAGSRPAYKLSRYRLVSLLPYAYAIIGTLYLGLQGKNLYPDYSFLHIKSMVQIPYFVVWALLSLIFWIPFFSRKPIFSLIHSLVFLYPIGKDLYMQFTTSYQANDIIQNDMKIYSFSLLLNLGVFLIIWFILFLFSFSKKKKTSL